MWSCLSDATSAVHGLAEGYWMRIGPDNLSFMCAEVWHWTCVRTYFFPCGGSFSYQHVPTLSDLGPKRKSQSHSSSAFGVEVHCAGLKILSGRFENLESLDSEMPTIFPLLLIFTKCPVDCKAKPSICISSMATVGNSARPSAYSFLLGCLSCVRVHSWNDGLH